VEFERFPEKGGSQMSGFNVNIWLVLSIGPANVKIKKDSKLGSEIDWVLQFQI